MTTQELMKIKQYQRDFEGKFGKKLYISWPEMKGVIPRITVNDIYNEHEQGDVESAVTAEQILNEVVVKHGTTLAAVRDRSKRAHTGMKCKERNALIEFSKIIVTNRMNRGYAARLINRDRTLLYHFAKLDYVQKM